MLAPEKGHFLWLKPCGGQWLRIPLWGFFAATDTMMAPPRFLELNIPFLSWCLTAHLRIESGWAIMKPATWFTSISHLWKNLKATWLLLSAGHQANNLLTVTLVLANFQGKCLWQTQNKSPEKPETLIGEEQIKWPQSLEDSQDESAFRPCRIYCPPNFFLTGTGQSLVAWRSRSGERVGQNCFRRRSTVNINKYL